MKYYEILPTYTETPRYTTRKIANLHIEFNYHFLTLQKKIPLLLNRSVQLSYNFFDYFGSIYRWTKPITKVQPFGKCPWRRHQMETFFALLALCAGGSSVTDEFRSQRPVTQSFDVFLSAPEQKVK